MSADRYDVFGFAFALAADSPAVSRSLRALYGPFAGVTRTDAVPRYSVHAPADARDSTWTVRLDDEPIAEAVDRRHAVRAAELDITERVVSGDRRAVWIHAALVGRPASAALLIGASGAGKSTLALSLAAHDVCVGGDDLVRLDPRTLTLLPVPRCFNLDQEACALLRRLGLRLPASGSGPFTPAEIPIRAASRWNVRHMVLLEPGPADGPPELSEIVQAETVTGMIAQVLGDSGRGAVAALAALAGGCSCHRLRRGDARRTSMRLAALLAAS